MEWKEREYIKKNLSTLILITDCNVLVRGKLRQHLSDCDVESLEIKRSNEGRIAQSQKFYDIMMMKANSYDDLINVLEQEKQQGAANILKQIKQGEKCRGAGVTKPPQSQPQKANNCDSLLVEKDPPCTSIRVENGMSRSGGQVTPKLMGLPTSLDLDMPDDDFIFALRNINLKDCADALRKEFK